MLIVGAGGLAAQLFEELVFVHAQDVVFWSEVKTKYGFITDKYKLIQSDDEVKDYFNNISKSFVLCVGGIKDRAMVAERFTNLGGRATSFISTQTLISKYVQIGAGTVIMSRVEIEAGTVVGERCLINKTANLAHGCVLGTNCEVAPGVIVLGEVEIGDNTFIGTRAVIFPKIKIGKNVTIAAGSIVKKSIPDNAVVAGEFASIKFYKK